MTSTRTVSTIDQSKLAMPHPQRPADVVSKNSGESNGHRSTCVVTDSSQESAGQSGNSVCRAETSVSSASPRVPTAVVSGVARGTVTKSRPCDANSCDSDLKENCPVAARASSTTAKRTMTFQDDVTDSNTTAHLETVSGSSASLALPGVAKSLPADVVKRVPLVSRENLQPLESIPSEFFNT